MQLRQEPRHLQEKATKRRHRCRGARSNATGQAVSVGVLRTIEHSFALPNYGHDVEVLNTGGWVVDTVERQPKHGGSLVVVDDDCRCAALRLYNETEKGHARLPVRAAAASENELSAALQRRIHATSDLWTSFAEAASQGVQARASALAQRAL